MKPILIMSVYSPGSVRWHKLQHQQLNATTDNYIHMIYCINLTNIQIKTLHDNQHTIIAGSIKSSEPMDKQHLYGLTQLTQHATTTCRGYLLLDSDCFPIQPWEDKLLSAMKNHDIACMVRPENLDVFPHPAACFTKHLERLRFKISTTYNLVGEKVDDIICEADRFFPLLRSNVINLHPVSMGIYYDLFYHHSCGSRPFGMRSFYNGYYHDTYDYNALLRFTDDFPRLLTLLRGERLAY